MSSLKGEENNNNNKNKEKCDKKIFKELDIVLVSLRFAF